MNRLIAERLVEARKVGRIVLINDDSVARYISSQPLARIKSDDRSAKLADQHNGMKRRYRRSGAEDINAVLEQDPE
jgi:hypothetical protein